MPHCKSVWRVIVQNKKNYRGTCGFTHWQKNPYPDLQRSVAAGELDPRVMLPAGIPTGIPAGYLCGPAPVSSLNSDACSGSLPFIQDHSVISVNTWLAVQE